MKRLILLLVLMPLLSSAQFSTIINWKTSSLDEELGASGLKIVTHIPVGSNDELQQSGGGYWPVINIEGYDYTSASTIALRIAWNNTAGTFENATVSSSGGYAPPIYLTNENNVVVIGLAGIGYDHVRLNVSTFSQDVTNQADWFEGWSISSTSDYDLAVEGMNPLIYNNNFSGDTQVKGLLTANSASIPTATVGKMTLGAVEGIMTAETDDPLDVGQVTLSPGDGGIEIVSGNDAMSYIDFKGQSNYLSDYRGRILHDDGKGFMFYTGGTTTPPRLRISNTGVVGIGTTTDLQSTSTDPYRLYVEGGVRTRKVKVDQVTPWPDYVFEPSYDLRSLGGLEEYIRRFKHLPDVPSADEITKDGVDLGETQAILLKKIEELTLYMIEQNKEIQILKKEVQQLKK